MCGFSLKVVGGHQTQSDARIRFTLEVAYPPSSLLSDLASLSSERKLASSADAAFLFDSAKLPGALWLFTKTSTRFRYLS